jgi:hypothetical protein
MNIVEAEIRGCPKHLIKKMQNHGIVNFSNLHRTDNINWGRIERSIDDLINSSFDGDDAKEFPIESRFEILDIR